MEYTTKAGKEKRIAFKTLAMEPVAPPLASPDFYNCRKCGLHKESKLPFVVPTVNPRADELLIVLDYFDDEANEERLLSMVRNELGLTAEQVTIIHALLCQSVDPKDILQKHKQACRGFLLHTIRALDPKRILAVGDIAAQTLMNEGDYKVENNLGKVLEIPGYHGTFISTLHPRLYEGTATRAPFPLVVKQIYRDLKRFDQEPLPYPEECIGTMETSGAVGLGFDTEFRTEDRTSWTASFSDGITTYTVDKELPVPIRPYFIENDHLLYAHYAHVDIDELVRRGIARECWVTGERVWCTNIAQRILDENRPFKGGYSLEGVARHVLPESIPDWKGATRVLDESDPESWGLTARVERCRLDAYTTYRVGVQQRLERSNELLYRLGNRWNQTYHRIQLAGACVDLDVFNKMESQLIQETKHLDQLITSEIASKYPKMSFQITKDEDLRNLIFKKLGLKGWKKTPTGQKSVDATVLESLRANPLVEKILVYKKAAKLLSTWFGTEDRKTAAIPLKERIWRGKINGRQMGYIPFKLNVFGAKNTGRRSGDSPNPQNWPKPVRRIITSRFENGRIAAMDYQKLEPLITSYVIGCPKLADYFLNKGGYIGIAKDLLKTDVKKDTEQYVAVKGIALGINYNAYPKTIAENLWYQAGIKLAKDYQDHVSETTELWEEYHVMFPELRLYRDQVEQEILETHQVVGALGKVRHIYLPEGKQTPGFYRKVNEAVNSRIQWMAAVITGCAVLDAESYIVNKYYNGSYLKYHTYLLSQQDQLWLKKETVYASHPYIINEVHDEITFDLPNKEDLDSLQNILEKGDTLKGLIPDFNLPLKVDVTVGKGWHYADS